MPIAQPSHAFPQFIPPRLNKAIARLTAALWQVDTESLPVWRTQETREHRAVTAVQPDEFKRVENRPMTWGKLFDQCWWRVDLQGQTIGDHTYLAWRDHGEATIYIDGKPWYGIDPGHHYAPLPTNARELIIESACCRTGIWVPGATQGLGPDGSVFDGAFLATRDEQVWQGLRKLEVLLELAQVFHARNNPLGQKFTDGGMYREPMDALRRRCVVFSPA